MVEVAKVLAEYDRIVERYSEIDLRNRSTADVYDEYVRDCSSLKIAPINKIAFSRVMINKLGYEVKDRKINGKKYRIFIK